ncbi:MAG TPA: TetR/AcrR family transcriptional regulator [Mycobacterium sp.]|nr:TetR/AcrR family transcriptional regulator [Mycobacterium sp.]
MVPPATSTRALPSRGRRASRPSGDDRELAILSTLERLLQERSLAEISVDDLAKGAGISRPTFYFYFPSKDAVLLTLLDRVIAEADAKADLALGGREPKVLVEPAGVWAGINALFEAFGSHRAVILAGAALRATNAEVGALWSTFMQKWISYTSESIRAERDRGAAPDTIPAEDLAISLNLMNERAMFAALAADPTSVPQERIVDTLAHIWVNSIYGAVRR